MKRLASLALVGSFLLSVSVRAGETDAAAKAQTAAKAWLALVDAGKYGESWDAAASLFKGAVTKEGWAAACAKARGPLGALKSRTLKSATYTKSLPGGPPGEYVVIQYDAAYEKAPSAVETVTPMLDKDGVWRVAGYYIK